MPVLGSSSSAVKNQKYGEIGIQLSAWVENIVGKGEIARNEQFLLFPQCFQKQSVVDVLKWVFMELRVKYIFTDNIDHGHNDKNLQPGL